MGEIGSSKTITYTDYKRINLIFQGREFEAYKVGKKETIVMSEKWENNKRISKKWENKPAATSKGSTETPSEEINGSITVQRNPNTHEVVALDISEGNHYLFMLTGFKKNTVQVSGMDKLAKDERYNAVIDLNHDGAQDANEPEVQVVLVHSGLNSLDDPQDPDVALKPLGVLRIIQEQDKTKAVKEE